MSSDNFTVTLSKSKDVKRHDVSGKSKSPVSINIKEKIIPAMINYRGHAHYFSSISVQQVSEFSKQLKPYEFVTYKKTLKKYILT